MHSAVVFGVYVYLTNGRKLFPRPFFFLFSRSVCASCYNTLTYFLSLPLSVPIGRIITTVQAAQASKPPIQELADRVAKYFVPVITGISLCTFVTWSVAYAVGAVPKQWYAEAGGPYLFAFFFALVSVSFFFFFV